MTKSANYHWKRKKSDRKVQIALENARKSTLGLGKAPEIDIFNEKSLFDPKSQIVGEGKHRPGTYKGHLVPKFGFQTTICTWKSRYFLARKQDFSENPEISRIRGQTRITFSIFWAFHRKFRKKFLTLPTEVSAREFSVQKMALFPQIPELGFLES